jgi:hypothetical protein
MRGHSPKRDTLKVKPVMVIAEKEYRKEGEQYNELSKRYFPNIMDESCVYGDVSANSCQTIDTWRRQRGWGSLPETYGVYHSNGSGLRVKVTFRRGLICLSSPVSPGFDGHVGGEDVNFPGTLHARAHELAAYRSSDENASFWTIMILTCKPKVCPHHSPQFPPTGNS